MKKYTVKTNFISTCEISEKARDGKISFAETEKIFFSYNPHENFPAKKMNKYFLHMKKYFFIFFAGKFSCGLYEKKIFFRFSKRKAVVFAVTCLSDISHENISNSVKNVDVF
jgi:hypothetical protein